MKLSVYLGENLAGYLESTAEKGVVFFYDTAYIKAGQPPISLSLPLSNAEFSQKMTPKVSVIVPNYNHALYLRPCIDSISNQFFQD